MKSNLLIKMKELRHRERFIKPDEAWIRATRQTLLLRAEQALPPQSKVKTSTIIKDAVSTIFPATTFQYMTRPVFAVLSFIVVILGGSMMSVNASERSNPGDFLYGLKIVTEQTRIAIASGKNEKLKLKTEFTGRRVSELRVITSAPQTDNQKVSEMASVLKQDMSTLKDQLAEVSKESTPAAAVEAAKKIDTQTNDVIVALQESKVNLNAETKAQVTEAQSAASETGVKAIEVMAVKHQEDGGTVSASAVADAIKEHAKIVTDVTNVPLPVIVTTSTASGTTLVVITAPTSTSSSTVPLPVALELGSSTGTQVTTTTIPTLLDQVKDATSQAFAIQKEKEVASSTQANVQTGTSTVITSTSTKKE